MMMPTTAAIPVLPKESVMRAREVSAQVAKPEHASHTSPASARKGVFASIAASVAFAALFSVPGMLTGLDPFATFGWRVIAALPFLVAILFVLRQWGQMGELLGRIRRQPMQLGILAFNALLFGVQMFLFAWGPVSGNALAVSFGYFLLPLAVVALGVVFLRERLSIFGIIAVVLAAAGVTIAFVAGASVSWATFAVAVGYPAYFILRRKFELDTPSAQSLEIALLAPVSLVFVLQPGAFEGLSAHPGNWYGLIALGLLTAVGFSAYTLAQRNLPMSVFGMLGYLEPILLVVVSVLLIGEPLGLADALSYGAIALGIIALGMDGVPKRSRSKQAKRPRPRASRIARRKSAQVSRR
ncbi:EamA family transporter RarD [Gulosibacter chungangensis]|nr:EamA family transporter RarD [Gulosibacter chungangensis]